MDFGSEFTLVWSLGGAILSGLGLTLVCWLEDRGRRGRRRNKPNTTLTAVTE